MLLKIKLTDLPPPPGSLPAWVPKCDIRAPRVPVSSLHPLSWSSTSSSFSSFLIFAFCPLSGPGSCHLVSALLAPHLSGPLPSTLSHHCPFQHRALSQASWSPEGLLTGGSPDECLFVFPDSSLLLWGADLSSGCCSTYALEKGKNFHWNSIYFLWFWRLGSPRSRQWQILYMMRALFLVHGWPTSLHVSVW